LEELRSEQCTGLGLIQPPASVFLNPAACSGTRMITHLIHIPTRLIASLPWVFTALSLRAFHAQAGTGSKTIAHYRVLPLVAVCAHNVDANRRNMACSP
jgi:hypothetical protein